MALFTPTVAEMTASEQGLVVTAQSFR